MSTESVGVVIKISTFSQIRKINNVHLISRVCNEITEHSTIKKMVL